jgi:CRP-like cAMP-binding protein
MIEVLQQHLIQRLGNNIADIDTVLSKFKIIEFKKNVQLLAECSVCKYVYFVAKGCLQVYVYDSNMN